LWLADLLHYTIGALFLLIGKSLFGTTRLACGFRYTKKARHFENQNAVPFLFFKLIILRFAQLQLHKQQSYQPSGYYLHR
jgi:hypothetical protein